MPCCAGWPPAPHPEARSCSTTPTGRRSRGAGSSTGRRSSGSGWPRAASRSGSASTMTASAAFWPSAGSSWSRTWAPSSSSGATSSGESGSRAGPTASSRSRTPACLALHYTPLERTMVGVATREERAAQLRIARPGLAERVNRALDSGSIVLTAGAGCGKTIALEQALALRPAPSVWLRCRPTDRDPGTLLRRLVQMISEVAPGAVDLLAERLAMAQEHVNARAAAAQLVDELDRLLPTQIVAAFDDAEALADSPGAVSLVGDLIAADSPVLRVAV